MLACTTMLTVSACGRDTPPVVGTQVIAPDDRGEALELSGETLGDGQFSTADYRGRVIVINNWASWCAPCRDEMPGIVAFAKANPDVQVVGLNVEDETAAAQEFATEFGMAFPSVVDADGSLLRTIPGVPPSALPSTVILDPEGRIAARVIGQTTPQQLDELVAQAAS